MSLVYNSKKIQYAVSQLLPKWGGWEGGSKASVGGIKEQPPVVQTRGC